LKFLIYIVLHKEEAPNATTSKDQAKKSLLDVLKTDDKLRNELFGHLSSPDNNQTKELSQEDKQALAKLGLMNINSAKLDNIKNNVNLDLELNDALQRSNVALKFVAFKTASTSTSSFPKSLFFTLKFFTFTTIQTDLVNLHYEKEIKPANQYYLVLPDQLKMR
jgi:hypothetical protein